MSFRAVRADTATIEPFETFYRREYRPVVGLVVALGGDTASAEDVAQETMLRLWRVAPEWRQGETKVTTWAYRVATNACLDELRRRRRHPEDPVETVPDRGQFDQDTDLDPDLRRALARLNDRHRTIMVLRYVLDASVNDIAAILGTNRTAVYAASARAERHLAKELEAVESASRAASISVRALRKGES